MQASNSVFLAFKNLLQKDPALLKKYVSVGLTLVDSAISPLDSFLKHLLQVQDLDPNTVPGERQRRALEDALMQSFNRLDEADFDEDYDFTWVDSKFQRTRQKLDHLNLTKKKFKDMSDISDWEPNPLSASIASKYDSHTVTPFGQVAKVEDPIGEPHRKHEDRIFLGESEEIVDKYNKMKESLNSFEETNPGVLDAATKAADADSDGLEEWASVQEAFDPRDPTLEKLEKLLKRVEAKASKSGLGKANLDGAITSAKSQLRGILDTRPELRDILNDLIGSEDGAEDDDPKPTRKAKTSKKTANKASRYTGSFTRVSPKTPKK